MKEFIRVLVWIAAIYALLMLREKLSPSGPGGQVCHDLENDPAHMQCEDGVIYPIDEEE